MRVSDFDFDLPDNLIADTPVTPRDSAKLLYIPTKGMFGDEFVHDMLKFLKKGDVMVFNNTRVIPARLKGKRDNAKVEVTLHKKISDSTWDAFAKPAKKLKRGDMFRISEDFHAGVIEKKADGEVTLEFNAKGSQFYDKLLQYGEIPLPPYIVSKRKVSEKDKETYQTIYAAEEGAVAAPTAGLHFTEDLLKKIDALGVKRVFLTLHVGAGTFLPVKTEIIREHKMHSEFFTISPETEKEINAAKKEGRRIVVVGTTSLRALESVADSRGFIKAHAGETNIFITPGYKFKVPDLLFTNFHLPRSTLFMLVCAFAGYEKMHAAYQHAIDNNYRFYSYGDACLLERA